MQKARVIGQGIATVKHPSMHGWRLLVVQPVTEAGQEDGEPLLAVDCLGAAPAHHVVISNDGAWARELVGSENSPVRWTILGVCD